MSKNLTRKGLAFGAILALGASLFAATPANAADELTLTPKTGTSYGSIEGETFTLSAGLAPATPAGNTVQLKYQVVTTATAVVKVNALNAAAAADTPTAGNTTKVTVGQATNTTVYKEYATPTVGAAQSINLTVSSVAALTPATAVVTAFFDANANDKLDSGEFSSAARTITWYDATDVVTTTTIDALTAGDTTASASLSFVNINNSQINVAHVGLSFTRKDGTTALAGLAAVTGASGVIGRSVIVSAAAGTGPSLLTYSSTKDAFVGKTVAFTAVNVTAGSLANQDVAVKPLYLVTGDGIATPAVTDVIGTSATLDAVARTIATIDATASGATGVKAGTAVQAAAPSTQGSLAVDASNAKDNTVTITATIKDGATTPAAVANVAVSAAVTGTVTSALSATNSYSINGTAYTAAPTAAVATTTNASGQVTYVVKNVTALSAGTVILTITAQNVTNVVTITFAAPTYVILDAADVAGSAGRTIAKATAYALNYKVLDQFGDAPSVAAPTAAFRLEDTVTTTNTGTYYASVAADGSATLSFATAATAGNTVHTVKLQKSADSFANYNYALTTGGFNATANTTNAADVNVVTTVVVKATAAEATASKIEFGTVTKGAGQASLGTITQTAPAAATFAGSANLASTDFAAFDGRVAKTSAPTLAKGYSTAPSHNSGAWTAGTASTNAGDAKVTIPVIVKDATVSNTAIDGASVTVAAKGFMFVVTTGGKTISGVDSLTFLADSTGTSVDVYSHVTGEQSIVFTSGTATSTQKITFVNYGTEVASVTMGDLAAQAQAGQSLGLSATAKDKWGNAVANVQIAFSNTGAGYIQDTAAKVTSATGVALGRLIALGSDLGTSTVTATAAKAQTLLTADLTSAKSVELGVTDADVTVGGRAIYASVEFAKGKTVTVTVDGKRLYSKLFSTDAYTELKFTQKNAGKHTVTIRISGGVVYSEVVTTTK